jgi:two-component sensor histidine kinase
VPDDFGNGYAGARVDRCAVRCENLELHEELASLNNDAARYEILLREGDHRIKNSLQIVASLMSMQARSETNPAASEALLSAATRVQSIARIHDALQDRRGEGVVNLGAVLRTMCETLHQMAGDPLRMAVQVDVESVEMPATLAQPIVLAVNELVINALRHAFPGDRIGVVDVRLARVGGELRIAVADDGVGLPPNYAEANGYGTRLVRMMCRKVAAKLFVDSDRGARFTILVPSPARVGLRLEYPQLVSAPA